MEINDITYKDFSDYERVRVSGKTNMFDIKAVVALSDNLTKEKCIVIIENYQTILSRLCPINDWELVEGVLTEMQKAFDNWDNAIANGQKPVTIQSLDFWITQLIEHKKRCN